MNSFNVQEYDQLILELVEVLIIINELEVQLNG